jgi:acetyl/propionyl-CoA carboxylase alpha subunit/acetyl-CoA carboxylase carboxyltransferase component
MSDRLRPRRLAIANRGEAAMRCVRAVKSLRALEGSSLECVALYTDVDRDAPFVHAADRAVRLDAPAGPVAAYLDAEGILRAVRRAGADSLWPGWGLLAEDPDFADRARAEGLVFLGPSGDAMRALGDKIGAKRCAERAGVPVLPWSGGPAASAEEAERAAAALGFPLLIKATAGGGGRGIREVRDRAELPRALAAASAEARAAFGDPTVFLERKLEGARHLEVQIAVDARGGAQALGVRECSVQRRHQKLIEEAPPPGVDGRVLRELEAAALRLVAEAGYVGVGTVEFLFDGDRFWLLEVNSRLQVEHGLSEVTTGLDLVHAQIRIARGEALPAPLAPPRSRAIEARICAEDPQSDFLAAAGRIARFEPSLGPGIRVDTGVATGVRVPGEFDSLLAKVIASGETREEARARLVCALVDFELVVAGGATNKGYLIELLEAPAFRSGRVDTGWVARTPPLRAGSGPGAVQALIAAAALSYQTARDAARQRFFADPGHLSPARIPAPTGQAIELSQAGEVYRLEVYAVGAWRYRVHLDGREVQVELRPDGPHGAILECAGRTHRVLHDHSEQGLRVEIDGRPHRFGDAAAGRVRAAAQAMVLEIEVAPGDRVAAGQRLGLLEAMKMEAAFHAPVGGVVREVCARAGQQVGAGDLLLVIDAGGAAPEAPAGERLALPWEPDPLDAFSPQPPGDGPRADLTPLDAIPAASRRAATEAVREEVRRVLSGYDRDPARVERLVAILQAEVPGALSESARWELAEVRHELALFADLQQLFIRSPRASVSGELGPSNHARLRRYVRSMRAEGSGLDTAFLDILGAALRHYGVEGLAHGETLERAVLRLLSSQLAPELRERLVLALVRRVQALAATGVHLAADGALAEALRRIAGMRGLVSHAVADAALEAAYAIFEAPEVDAAAERTTKEVEAWLGAAESSPTPPPPSVLLHLAEAPPRTFARVRRWLDDPDPRRRALAVVAQLRRLYAPAAPTGHTSAMLREVIVERLEFPDGRVVVGSVAAPRELERALACLGRSARAGPESARDRAVELLVAAPEAEVPRDALAAIEAFVAAELPAGRLTATFLGPGRAPVHRTWLRSGAGTREEPALFGLHPETAARVDLARLRAFELERLDAPEDLYAFHLRSPEAAGDERLFVLADVRGRSPDAPAEMSLHVAAFERAFFDAARTLRNLLGVRDPARRLQWNRIMLFVAPPVFVDPELAERLSRRLAPVSRDLGLEKVVVRLDLLERSRPADPPRPVEVVIADPTGSQLGISWRDPHREPLRPAEEYERRVVAARRRGLVHPHEIVRLLTGGTERETGSRLGTADLPPARFEEFELDPDAPHPVAVSVAGRAPGRNASGVVFGIVTAETEEVPEGMARVLILSDPTRHMGALAAPECDRIVAAIDLAETRGLPVEWVPVSSGARIAMDSGTENLDATARVVRRIVTFTRAGGAIHVIVYGVNVGAQSYFDALATMGSHSRGALVMTPGGAMVLTGRAALEASGAVSAEDEVAIGGYERVMGPNGEAHYYARDLLDAYRILYEHYRLSYAPPGSMGPRWRPTSDPASRPITAFATPPESGHEFDHVGGIFDPAENADRKRPFSMRTVMAALVDRDAATLERWRAWVGAETAVVWDARLGGHAVSVIGIESRNLPREGHRPSDGPDEWTGGTLFPQSSKKVARALNAASGNRPVVILANLSGFDGSPESMRKGQLEWGAAIARAVVEFRGPLLFVVVSRYHGGAYVVFSRELNDGLRASALEGSFASVIGGAPAAAVVFTREVRARAAADPRVARARTAASEGDDEAFEPVWREVLLECQAEVAREFDAVHSVERAREVGSLEEIVAPEALREHLIAQLDAAAGRAGRALA